MALNAKKIAGNNAGPKQQAIEPGTYPVRIVQIIDLGIQEQRPFQGKEKPPAHEIMITYEFCDEFVKDEDGNDQLDKPRWLSETIPLFNLKADKAKSTQRYNAFDPTDSCDGDFTRLVGLPGLITVVNKNYEDKVYNNVFSAAAVRAKEADRMPPLVNEPRVFVLDEPDMEVFENLPEWIQDKIKKNLHFQGSALQKALKGAVGNNNDKAKVDPQPKKEEQPQDDVGAEDAPW